MFTKPLSYIITKKSLLEAYESINKATSGIDDITFEVFEKDLDTNLERLLQSVIEGKYAPEPLKKIAIDKPNSDEKRPIGLSETKKEQLLHEIELQELYGELF